MYFLAYECFDGHSVLFRAYNVYLVAVLQGSLVIGHNEFLASQHACAYHVAAQELAHRVHRLSVERVVCYYQRHGVRLCVCVVVDFALQCAFLVFKVNAAYIAYQYGSAYNAEHAKRICASVTRSYLRNLRALHCSGQCFVGRTETRGVCYRSKQHAHHHRQVVGIVSVEEQVVKREHYPYVQQHEPYGEHVESHSAFAETLEERRANLQAYAVDE